MNRDSLVRIKKKLPKKWVAIIHNETKLSKSYIQKVMSPNDDRTNSKIIKAAITLAKLTEREKKEIENEIKSI